MLIFRLSPFVFLFFLVATGNDTHAKDLCSQIFSNEVPDQEGLINFLKISPEARIEQENIKIKTPVTPIDLSNETLKRLRDIVKKERVHAKMKTGVKRQLVELLNLKPDEISKLSKDTQIELFSIFAHANRLPPKAWSQSLLDAMTQKLDSWESQQFQQFAFARKLTPLKLSRTFRDAYIKTVLERFPHLSLRAKLEVLGAELLHESFLGSKDISFLFIEMTRSLNQAPNKKVALKLLKELYRGILSFRSIHGQIFRQTLYDLEMAIETHMNKQGLSLLGGGTSGARNPIRKTPEDFLKLQKKIQEQLIGHEALREVMNPYEPGFFDPVDIYYPSLKLVVEWDGFHHYFRFIDHKANVLDDIPEILRPMDAARDSSLRLSGLKVLRFQRRDNHRLNDLIVIDMINEQNPTERPVTSFYRH